MHSATLAVVPSVDEQTGMAEHLLREEEQKRPFVGVQAAAPQMHPALLAVLPSVSVQRALWTQRQELEEEHLIVEVVRALN
jgi:hypothetical protein